jgi:acyl carrier protein phosphodiesterase
MNFLAHLYLSDGTPGGIIGNLFGDFVKGREVDALHPEVQVGVRRHRLIDRLTDNHPVFSVSKYRLAPKWGRYSPIIVDVFYDHVLARTWDTYSPESLRDYLDRHHALLRANHHLMTEDMRTISERVINDDRLMSYREIAGIRFALERITVRLKRCPLQLGDAADDLAVRYDEFAEDFAEFFPELREGVGGIVG